MKKQLALVTAAVTLLGLSSSIGMAQEIDGQNYRNPSEGNWYHPIEQHAWEHIGSEPDIITAVLARISGATGERSEADQPDTIKAFGPGNWVYEWSGAGDAALAEAIAAEASGDADLAKRKFIAAASYYVRASSPHTNASENLAALKKGQAAYREAGRFLPVPLQVIEVPFEGRAFETNLHLPDGDGPFPLVVMSFGSDVAKEEALAFFEKQLALRGIALLTLDMPGMGDSVDWTLSADIDKLHAAAVEHAKTLPEIDGRNIFVMGASFGGAPAARLFLARPELDLAGVISICGLMHQPFMAPPEAYYSFPAFTLDGVRARLGLAVDAPFEAFAEKMQSFSLVGQGLMGDQSQPLIETPLLALSTNNDPVAPLADLELLMARAANVKSIVYDLPGHCPDRDSREAIAASWIVDQLRDE